MQTFTNLHPKLKIAIDHAVRPPIATRTMHPWADDLARLAKDSNVCCKLSGLATEAGPEWQMNDMRPWFEHICDCFGPSRLMWGSDWPVIEMSTPYQRWLTITHRFLFRYSLPDQDEIMCDTAVRFYGLS